MAGPPSSKGKTASAKPLKEVVDEPGPAMQNPTSKRKRNETTAAAPRKKATAKASTKASETAFSIPGALDVVGTYKVASAAMQAEWNPPEEVFSPRRAKLVKEQNAELYSIALEHCPGPAALAKLDKMMSSMNEPEPVSESDLKMTVYHKKVNTKYQLFATFDFQRGIAGLMRFEKTIPSPSAIVIDKANNDAPKHVHSGYNTNHRSRDADYKRKAFLLDADDIPTTQRRTWRYRWRGRSQKDDDDDEPDEIQFQSDQAVNLLTFISPTSITGTFNGMPFTAQKLPPTTTTSRTPDPDEIWKAHGERAYRSEKAELEHEFYAEPDCEPDEMGDENYAKIRRTELKAERQGRAEREERMDENRRFYREEKMAEGYGSEEIDSDECSEDEETMYERMWAMDGSGPH